MSKAVLVIDMPKSCWNCPMVDGEYGDCQLLNKEIRGVDDKRMEGCPLRPYQEAIPIEWIEEWGWKNGMSESMSLRVMIDDWEKENERKKTINR